jgi:hypothetical protein
MPNDGATRRSEKAVASAALYIHGTGNSAARDEKRGITDLVLRCLAQDKDKTSTLPSGSTLLSEMVFSKKSFFALFGFCLVVVSALLYTFNLSFHKWLWLSLQYAFSQPFFNITNIQSFISNFLVESSVILLSLSLIAWTVRWYEVKSRQCMAPLVNKLMVSNFKQVTRCEHIDEQSGPCSEDDASILHGINGRGFKNAVIEGFKKAKESIDQLIAENSKKAEINYLCFGFSRGGEVAAIIARWLYLIYKDNENVKISLGQLDPVFEVKEPNELILTRQDLMDVMGGKLTDKNIDAIMMDMAEGKGVDVAMKESDPSSCVITKTPIRQADPVVFSNYKRSFRITTMDRRPWMKCRSPSAGGVNEGTNVAVNAHHSFMRIGERLSDPLRYNPQQLIVQIILNAYHRAVAQKSLSDSDFNQNYSKAIVVGFDKMKQEWADAVQEYRKENPFKASLPWLKLETDFLKAVEWRCPGTPAQKGNSSIITTVARIIFAFRVWIGWLPPASTDTSLRQFFAYHKRQNEPVNSAAVCHQSPVPKPVVPSRGMPAEQQQRQQGSRSASPACS